MYIKMSCTYIFPFSYDQEFLAIMKNNKIFFCVMFSFNLLFVLVYFVIFIVIYFLCISPPDKQLCFWANPLLNMSKKTTTILVICICQFKINEANLASSVLMHKVILCCRHSG